MTKLNDIPAPDLDGDVVLNPNVDASYSEAFLQWKAQMLRRATEVRDRARAFSKRGPQ